jgi:3-deoxy-D-manno-octulosonate 8-phosphate phosphatase (KDO 8-P phosphatase)
LQEAALRLTSDVGERARRIKLILMDVDGVLTDARIILQAEVDEAKGFDARDGVGIRLAQRAGLLTGVITGRLSIATSRRTRELRMEEFHQKVFRKTDVLEAILKARRMTEDQICFIGDDLVDVPVMKRAGLAACPGDARLPARRVAHFVTSEQGGRGAVREVIEFILKAQGLWARVTADYL